ncbi:L-dopachrome tautomerase-related protein [Azospirillum sp. SYSU D00513]|uniref:L-dopachrome tautomerase-related protein n=1 Tax=Azospirillum sp. SYSU D00513 TaxID=2812561 RepID=UPI001A96BBB9|nr:L-dopachrome tautomerase-related protein [Azospirillum sp. SYSU D00513]
MKHATLAAMLAAAFLNSTAATAQPASGPVERVATFHDAMPTGVTVAPNGRIFVNYPRWGDDVPFTVAEIRGGKAVPYPDAAVNRADPGNPGGSLLSVQSVVADARNRLWMLDTAAPGFRTPVAGGAKLVAVDLATDRIIRTIVVPPEAALPTTYLNDVRFDLRQGAEGVAYITDSSVSGPGGIIVVDLATGRTLRRLSGHPSTSPEPGFQAVIEGQAMMARPADGAPQPFRVASDGIALSADGQTLYYCALSSRRLYAVPTAALRDPALSEEDLAALVVDLGEKGASDGLEADDKGRVYAGDYEHNAIRRLEQGRWSTVVEGPEILWPDTLSVGPDGYLYFTANQLHRQAGFNGGRDLRQKPYQLLRVRIDAGPVLLK